jgi:hypothetical protein
VLDRDVIQSKTTAARLKAIYKEDRIQAAQTLAKMGPRAEAAIPLLIEAMDDKEPTVVAAVSQALAGIGPPVVEPLTMALFDKEYNYRLPVIVALGESGLKKAVKPLADILRSDDVDAKCEAIASLGQLGPLARDAIPALQLAEKDNKLSPSAKDALARIEGKHQLGEYLQWNMLVVLGILVTVVGVLAVFDVGGRLLALPPAARIPALTAFGWFLIGGTLGGIVGGNTYGKAGAVKCALIFGVGGGLIGYVVGSVAGTAVEPLGRIMGGK